MSRPDRNAALVAAWLALLVAVLMLVCACAQLPPVWPRGDPWPNPQYMIPGSPTCEDGCAA